MSEADVKAYSLYLKAQAAVWIPIFPVGYTLKWEADDDQGEEAVTRCQLPVWVQPTELSGFAEAVTD